jgi:hypothetical protein
MLLVGGAFVPAHSASVGPLAGPAVARYERRPPLVISPVFVYASYLGRESAATALAVDAAGNAYVTGTTSSTEFPTTGGRSSAVSPAGAARRRETCSSPS